MRQWQAPLVDRPGGAVALGSMIRRLGQEGFETAVLEALDPVVPAASWSVYRTGRRCRPTMFMSATRGIPDTTRDCWWAYLSGPYLHDRTLGAQDSAVAGAADPRLCHVMAQEVGLEHRQRVYEAHGMAERLSVLQHEADAVFAVNFYRHQHQRPFTDRQIVAFEEVSTALLELARKHIALTAASSARAAAGAAAPAMEEALRSLATPVPMPVLREMLQGIEGKLTGRELDVCVRLLQGMTHEGIACDLGLGGPTVKTYRNRAFARLGIGFRSELFALVLKFLPRN